MCYIRNLDRSSEKILTHNSAKRLNFDSNIAQTTHLSYRLFYGNKSEVRNINYGEDMQFNIWTHLSIPEHQQFKAKSLSK